ncbi:hypothetical protein HK102_008102 [Quaeritorhiza haematococci]|nr:hypothetical protein HK102_008102 [Quaeritorhiza haematococci]
MDSILITRRRNVTAKFIHFVRPVLTILFFVLLLTPQASRSRLWTILRLPKGFARFVMYIVQSPSRLWKRRKIAQKPALTKDPVEVETKTASGDKSEDKEKPEPAAPGVTNIITPAAAVVAERVEQGRKVEKSVPKSLSVQRYQPHPHATAVNRAFSLLNTLTPMSSGWTCNSVKGRTRISTRPIEGVALPMIRGDALIHGTWTPQEIVSVIRSSVARKVWDARFESVKILEVFNTNESLSYVQQKGTFPVAGRDFVCATALQFGESVEEPSYFLSTSVVDQKAPQDPNRVRGELALAGWVLKPSFGGVTTTYIVQVDVKGYIPSALIKRIQVQTPMCILEVEKYLEQNGPFPFLVRSPQRLAPKANVTISKEDFLPSQRLFQLDVEVGDPASLTALNKDSPSIKDSVLFAIALPKKMYAKGAEVILEPKPRPIHAQVVDVAEARGHVSGATSAIVVFSASTAPPKASWPVQFAVAVKPGTKSGIVIHSHQVEEVVRDSLDIKKIEERRRPLSLLMGPPASDVSATVKKPIPKQVSLGNSEASVTTVPKPLGNPLSSIPLAARHAPTSLTRITRNETGKVVVVRQDPDSDSEDTKSEDARSTSGDSAVVITPQIVELPAIFTTIDNTWEASVDFVANSINSSRRSIWGAVGSVFSTATKAKENAFERIQSARALGASTYSNVTESAFDRFKSVRDFGVSKVTDLTSVSAKMTQNALARAHLSASFGSLRRQS